MKANEIQIGDWLYYKGQFNAFPFKVESITKKKVGYHAEPNEHRMYHLRLSECKPIPLTPEILEKNGFEREGGASRCRIDRWWLSILHWNKDRLELIISDDSTKLYILDIDLKYVHQLQHILSVIGVNKTIIL